MEDISKQIDNALKDSPGNFSELIKKPNKQSVEQLGKVISRELADALSSGILVGVTGSDGRGENLPGSSVLDLVVYSEGDTKSIKEKLSEIDPNINNVEVVKIDEGWEHLFYWGLDKPIFFPTRFLDLSLIGGDGDFYRSLWESYLRNLKELPGKKYKRFLDRLRTHKKALKKGFSIFKGKKLEHFDPSFRKVFYEKISGVERGVKISHLRPIQYFVASEIFRLIRAGRIYTVNDLLELDKSIAMKIRFLIDEYYLKIPEDVIDSYIGFLWIHLLTKKFFQGEPVVVDLLEFSREKLKCYHIDLVEFF